MDPRQLSRRDLRRLVHDMWEDPRCDEITAPALDAAFVSGARSVERTLIQAYLRHFPIRHRSFRALRQAVSMLAERNDWPWRQRGRDWQLWDESAGPVRLARALLATDNPAEALSSAGLDGDLGQGEYVTQAVSRACELATDMQGLEAEKVGHRLIALAVERPVGQSEPKLLKALLWPWRSTTPTEDYKKHLLNFLVARHGDPRFQQARWDSIVQEIGNGFSEIILAILKRWLTDQTVRRFFQVVGFTTKDTVQWAERREFWEGYLDASMIEDAWFALGSDAESLINAKTSELAGQYATIFGGRQYADPSHSSLVLAIGNLRVAEWSHNGACRFWLADDRQAPVPYKSQYAGIQLRAMNGGKGFEYIPHQGGWQNRFAAKVAEVTGRIHPRFGAGYRVRSYY